MGHDIGGVCISYAMEMFPRKIAKSIFISATMITDGQRAFDAFSLQVRLYLHVISLLIILSVLIGYIHVNVIYVNEISGDTRRFIIECPSTQLCRQGFSVTYIHCAKQRLPKGFVL